MVYCLSALCYEPLRVIVTSPFSIANRAQRMSPTCHLPTLSWISFSGIPVTLTIVSRFRYDCRSG